MVNTQGLCEAKDVTNKTEKTDRAMVQVMFHFPVPHVTSNLQPAESLLVGKN